MDNDYMPHCTTYMSSLHSKKRNRFRYFVLFSHSVAMGSRQHFLSPYYVQDYFLRIFYDSQTTYEALEYYNYM
jgi:hypothetical protein